MNWFKVIRYSVLLYVLPVLADALTVYIDGTENISNPNFVMLRYAISITIATVLYFMLVRGQTTKPDLHAVSVYALAMAISFMVSIVLYYLVKGFIYPNILFVVELILGVIPLCLGTYCGIKFRGDENIEKNAQ